MGSAYAKSFGGDKIELNMGEKGDIGTKEAQLFAELLVEKLSMIKGISSKKMFGGHGIFHEGKMFGIIDPKGQAYFKVNTALQSDYEKNDSHRHGKMPYFSIPKHVLDNDKILSEWAKKSIEISKA